MNKISLHMGLISQFSDAAFWKFIHTYRKFKILSLNFINAIMHADTFGHLFKAYAFSSSARSVMVSHYCSLLKFVSVSLVIAQLKLKGKKKNQSLRLNLFLRIHSSKFTLKIPREHVVAEYRCISCFNF